MSCTHQFQDRYCSGWPHAGSRGFNKYGCSDATFHKLGAMPFLFWKLVEERKASGAERIDLRRTDIENEGVVVFKDRLGAKKNWLTYYR